MKAAENQLLPFLEERMHPPDKKPSALARKEMLSLLLLPRAYICRFATAETAFFLALLVIVSSCSSTSIPTTNIPTATPGVISTLAPTSTPTPTPTAPPLGAVPQDCPPGPRLQNIFTDIIPVVGGSPVWAAGFVGPHAILHVGNGISTQNNVYTQHGWYRKILWRVSTNSPSPVTLHGGSLHDGTPLWFQIGNQDLTLSPVLDPGNAGEQPWTSFPSYIFIPQAGCYYLEAHWSSGSWRITFAAGL